MTGDEVKQIRLKHNLSQEEFGRKIGMAKSGISNIENNLRNVSKKTEYLIRLIFLNDESYYFSLSDIPTKDLLKELERRCK
ncbi:MAG: helix-turn-helix transcriptional regulator [Clostridia bacterium]|nr:helix-turn-helix transcriptional regulator [Clostridia bacterium]